MWYILIWRLQPLFTTGYISMRWQSIPNWVMNWWSTTAFTDIVFNPEKSINCQAEACAYYVALRKKVCWKKRLAKKRFFLRFYMVQRNKRKLYAENWRLIEMGMPEMTGVRKCKGKNLRLIIPNEFVIGTIGILFFLFDGEAVGESCSPICVED